MAGQTWSGLMKLLNFHIKATAVELAEQIFELHNFDLQSYTYDTKKRIFKLQLRGNMSEASPAGFHEVITDLQIIFRDVTFLRIQDSPYEDQYFCLVGMEFVNEILARTSKPNLLVQVDNLFDSDEFPVAEWPNYLLINFIGGVDILIAAATAEVSFQKLFQGANE
jgi:hypothetical protein